MRQFTYRVEKRKDESLNIDLVYLVLQNEEICFSNVWTGEMKIRSGMTKLMEKMGIGEYSTTRAKNEYPILQEIEDRIKIIGGVK